ncbi:MAG: hypothetical protein AAF799_30010 [Myxococcota bacterium]
MKPLALLTCLLLLGACAEPTSPAPSTDPRAATEEPPASNSATDPASLESLRVRLRARHTEDLPTPQELARTPGAAESLRHLATHDERMNVRVRALSLLRFDASEATRSLLVEVIEDPAMHPSLRAAAIVGSGALPLEGELGDLVDEATGDSDPRVSRAASERQAAPDVVVDPGAD